jgi:magnesium-transporting ATPase (P-type)
MQGRHERNLLDGALLGRALGVLGLTEAVASMAAFLLVLTQGGWSWGEVPSPSLLALASGTAFATISLCQMGNAFACRSSVRPVWRMDPRGNPLVLAAVAGELGLLLLFVGLPSLSSLLGGAWPSATGWVAAVAGAGLLLVVDGVVKWLAGRRWRAAHPAV